MIITVKSTPSHQIEFKKVLGFKNLEIQLINEKTSINDFKETICFDNIDILSVHTPICNGLDVDINTIIDKRYYDMLYGTCELAHQYSNYYKHPVFVVIHNSWSKKDWINNEKSRIEIIEIFKKLVKEFPNLKFAIENTTPYENLYLNKGYEMEDICEIVNFLNKEIPGKKFGIVLDVCHLLMTHKMKTKLFNFETSINKFLKDNIELVKEDLFIIHLNNCHVDGTGKDHGIAFYESNETDMKILDTIISTHKSTNALICLEIREDDYTNCINLETTYKSLEKILNKLNIKDINK